MAVDVAQLVGGAFGGALVSSILTPLITQRRERRDLRADVLRGVGELERKRWAGHDREQFREAVQTLRAAALVAGAKRDAVDHYTFLAQVARRTSDRDVEMSGMEPGEPYAGSIPGELGDLVTDAAELVVEQQWHPVQKRWSISRRLKENREAEASLREQGSETGIDWDPPAVYGWRPRDS